MQTKLSSVLINEVRFEYGFRRIYSRGGKFRFVFSGEHGFKEMFLSENGDEISERDYYGKGNTGNLGGVYANA